MEKRPKIGLALGSGGARGLTQIGILQVLKENNVPIDYIAGVSIGAIVGSYYSLYGDVIGLEKEVKKISKKDIIKLVDILSFTKGMEGKKVTDFLIKLIGDKNFSDLKIPLKIIATDLESGEEIHFSKGKIKDAIRATIAIPGVFKPYSFKGKKYADGGIVNPTPIDVVREMGADIVIAVDHTMGEYKKIHSPTTLEVIMRTFEIVRTQTTKLKMGKIDDRTILISIKKKSFKDTYNFYNKKFILEGRKIGEENIKNILKKIEKYSPNI